VIRTVTPEDIPALADVLGRAFEDDPVAGFAHPREASRLRRLRFFFTGRLRTLVPEELCFTDENRAGAALWAPPDRWQMPAREAVVGTLRLLSRRTPAMLAGLRRAERLHPRSAHFYLSVLGVDPGAQGRGLGSALLRPMLERCDAEGVGAYLETSKASNISFYERHGFRVRGELRLPRGPMLWLMWRDPR